MDVHTSTEDFLDEGRKLAGNFRGKKSAANKRTAGMMKASGEGQGLALLVAADLEAKREGRMPPPSKVASSYIPLNAASPAITQQYDSGSPRRVRGSEK